MSENAFIFRAYRAIAEPDTCNRFMEGHKSVLRDYGITNITTNNAEWTKDPDMYCVIAELEETGEMIGGVRVQVSAPGKPLPVEKAVGDKDPKVEELITNYRENGGVGELCALWNAKKVAGIGISLLLIRAGISIVNQVEIASLITICADYTLPMVKRVGFIVEESLGNEGEFVYPNENYIARVLRRINTITLDTANPFDRERILFLRNNPEIISEELGHKEQLIQINYQLKMPLHSLIM
jgi:hypothetical protein